jgi:phosphoglycerate dehydrogenase-like enzyme
VIWTGRQSAFVGYCQTGRRIGKLAAGFGMRVLTHAPVNPLPTALACPDLAALRPTATS